MTTLAPNGRLHVVVTGDFDDAQLREALRAHEGIDVLARSADIRAAAPALGSVELDAVLHGTALSSAAEALCHEVAAIRRFTSAPIILLAAAADPQLADTAIAAGVEDVLVLPQMAETIAFAIRKARAGARRPDRRAEGGAGGEVVTVFSPKGGTGKTVLSTNLASLLASRGDERVLLIDLDLQFGDAAIMLGLDPERTLASLVLDPGELDAEKLGGYTMRHRSGLDVLAAPLRPEEAELVSELKVLRLLEVARQAYDLVVVDTSPFFYGPMLALLEPTDHLLLLCGLDVPTLKNVRLSLRTLELLGFPRERTSLVLNRVAPKVGITREDVEQALGMPVSFELPNDPVVAQAVNRGTPAALLDADSDFAHAVQGVAGALRSHDDEPAVAGTPAARFRWLDGTRRRLLEGRA
ncbi:MAG TPA: AAA family ATPase [Gaiellaceae bacterium]